VNNKREILLTLPVRRPFKNVFQFKITLLETDPPVWRRIQVPESFSFYDLHVAIQDAMGWMDYHLHMFEIEGAGREGNRVRIDCPFGDIEFVPEDYYLTTEVLLNRFFKKENDRALYTYDFGDSWEHDILLEKIVPREPRKKYPVCLDGRLACPPEDCGSVDGYYRCIEALKNRDNSDGLLDWLGNWRSDKFNPKKVVFENPRKRLDLAFRD
jgi:hypothetical protein